MVGRQCNLASCTNFQSSGYIMELRSSCRKLASVSTPAFCARTQATPQTVCYSRSSSTYSVGLSSNTSFRTRRRVSSPAQLHLSNFWVYASMPASSSRFSITPRGEREEKSEERGGERERGEERERERREGKERREKRRKMIRDRI